MTANPPLVWAVLSDKAGDNAQVEAVIERLPWPVTRRTLVFKKPFRKGKPPFLVSLYHVDKTKSDPLEPPWPALVLTIGRRPAMAAMWIRRRSDNRTRIVLFGRPKRDPSEFALIVASAQFSVPAGENVIETALPLMRIDERKLTEAAATWQPQWEGLPRPLIAVLVGGATRPYAFGAAEARELIERARVYADGGTLYVTTSRRTGRAAIAALRERLPHGARFWQWGDATPNPYLGLLSCADGFVVTGDSMSMITEVARLGRPLAIYPLPLRPISRFARRALPSALAELPARAKYRWLPRLGFTAFPRDLTEVHRLLFARGRAVPAGRPFSAARAAPDDDLDAVARAIVAKAGLPETESA
jgi:mitochondrial fission protein ELM1